MLLARLFALVNVRACNTPLIIIAVVFSAVIQAAQLPFRDAHCQRNVNGKLAVRNTPAEIVQLAFLVFGQITRLSFGSVLLVMRGGGKFRQFAFFRLCRCYGR